MYTQLDFCHELRGVFDFFTGVPDGKIKEVFNNIKPWHPAPREDHAVAMAFGARLAGKRPAVLMQNSGVGYIGDVLLGLHTIYGTGVVLVVSCRGARVNEEIQHVAWGYDRTKAILEDYGVTTVDVVPGTNAVHWAADLAYRMDRVVALLIRPEVFDAK